MERIEFRTTAKNGIIEIPKKYRSLENSKIKVIITNEDDELKKLKKKELLKLLKEAARRDIFSKIKDPIEWQRRLRNKWEKY